MDLIIEYIFLAIVIMFELIKFKKTYSRMAFVDLLLYCQINIKI